MSIATAITALQGKIANAYTAIENKGGTLPATQNAANLATAIEDIPSGGEGGPIWGINALSDVCKTRSDPGNGKPTVYFFGGVTKLKFDGIQAVGYYPMLKMFANNNSLTSVSFPDLLSSKNNAFESAFMSCKNLVSVSMPKNRLEVLQSGTFSHAFEGCSSLTAATVLCGANSVKGDTFNAAFKGCSSLSSLPGGVSEIDFCDMRGMQEAFRDCTSLTGATFTNLSSMSQSQQFASAFIGCTSLQTASFAELSSFDNNSNSTFRQAFVNCSSLTAVSFPKLQKGGISSFTSAFTNCTALKSVDFSALSATKGTTGESFLFGSAFENCTSLESASFPSLKTADGNNALQAMFKGCTSLTSVSMPNLSSHGTNCFKWMFQGCTALKDVPSFIANLSSVSGYEVLLGTFENCTSLSSVSFPNLTSLVVNGTQSSGMYQTCFKGCTNLSSVAFPEVLSVVHQKTFQEAFANCTNLSSVTFPKLTNLSADRIFASAFTNCTSLTSISFPALSGITSGVNTFENAFNGCTALTEIHFKTGTESVITALNGYSSRWGASNATIHFDL